MQIKKKLPLIMIILICIPLFFLAIVIYGYSSRALIIKSENNIKQLAITEGRALEALIRARTYNVEMLATDKRVIEILEIQWLEGTSSYSERLEEVWRLLKETYYEEDIYDSFVLNTKGKVVAYSEKNGRLEGVNNEVEFKRVLEGNVSFENIMLTEIDGMRLINITTPVRNADGLIIGAVCKVLSNEAIANFVNEIKLDQTGYAYVVDSEGYILAHPDKDKQGKKVENEDIKRIVETGLQLQAVTTILEYETSAGEVHGAFYSVPHMEWTIAICQMTREIRQQAVMEFIIIVITTILLVIAVSIVSIMISRKITSPIDELIQVMGRVSEGALDQFYGYDKADEFGTLAKHYNIMIKRLSDTKREVDRVVEELTATQEELRYNFVALEKSKEDLSTSEERYRRTLDGIEEAVWEYTIASEEFVAIGKWEDIFEEVNCGNIKKFLKRILSKQGHQTFEKSISKCIRGKSNVFTHELLITLSNGKQKWILCKGNVVKDEYEKSTKLVGIVTDITTNKLNEEKVRELAYFDTLTGFLNKETFMKQLTSWLEDSKRQEKLKQGALFFIDLDDFKKINDTLGHDIGDQLLNFVARMIKSQLPNNVLISRFGGDEFVVFLEEYNDTYELEELIYSILNIFRNNIELSEEVVHITCSIGVSLYPLDGETSDVLLKNADMAMYKVKDTGKNSYSFYAADMTRTLARKLVVESALRDAIDKEGLYLQYQPIVDLISGKTIAAEALVRLRHETLGFISPGEFIPIAEETGLIIPTGQWVLETALKELRRCHNMGFKEFTMSINISSVQMRQNEFIDRLVETIRKSKVTPSTIKLEVTESVLMEDVEKSKIIFQKIKELGVKIALDDFGTGYSSLNYLWNIPLDILKIDKSFIDGITTSTVISEIVDSIISMAHILGIKVVAEGVESMEQLELLKVKGCDMVQGYVFSRPLPEEDLEDRLDKEDIEIAN